MSRIPRAEQFSAIDFSGVEDRSELVQLQHAVRESVKKAVETESRLARILESLDQLSKSMSTRYADIETRLDAIYGLLDERGFVDEDDYQGQEEFDAAGVTDAEASLVDEIYSIKYGKSVTVPSREIPYILDIWELPFTGSELAETRAEVGKQWHRVKSAYKDCELSNPLSVILEDPETFLMRRGIGAATLRKIIKSCKSILGHRLVHWVEHVERTNGHPGNGGLEAAINSLTSDWLESTGGRAISKLRDGKSSPDDGEEVDVQGLMSRIANKRHAPAPEAVDFLEFVNGMFTDDAKMYRPEFLVFREFCEEPLSRKEWADFKAKFPGAGTGYKALLSSIKLDNPIDILYKDVPKILSDKPTTTNDQSDVWDRLLNELPKIRNFALDVIQGRLSIWINLFPLRKNEAASDTKIRAAYSFRQQYRDAVERLNDR